jgi:hypothetical protein
MTAISVNDSKPKAIRIMADFCYAAFCWEIPGGELILLEDFYSIAPEVKAIDKDLLEWQEWFERDCYDRNGSLTLHFESFHEKGMSLTRRLAFALKPLRVEVYYQRPPEDPNKGNPVTLFRVDV